MIYWGSKNKEITQRVCDLCASKSMKLIEALISSSGFKTFSNCYLFHIPFSRRWLTSLIIAFLISQVTCKNPEYSKAKSNGAMKKF